MKNVKSILIDPKEKTIKEVKFNGSYDFIQDQLNGDVNHIELVTGDLLFYEYPQDECESEEVTIVGTDEFRGKVMITGSPTKNSDEHNWRCKNVQIPMSVLEQHVRYMVVPLEEMV